MEHRTLSRLAVPAAAALLALTTACTAGTVQGRPGASGLRDPYFPKAGNGGYQVEHYDLDLDYDPAGKELNATAVITARAQQGLSAFNLDLAGLDVEGVTVQGKGARFNRTGRELTVRPAEDLKKGELFRTEIDYHGKPKPSSMRTAPRRVGSPPRTGPSGSASRSGRWPGSPGTTTPATRPRTTSP